MSWAEVKKINSDLFTPLDVLSTIQYVNLVGDAYKPSLEELQNIASYDAICSYSKASAYIGQLVFEFILEQPNGVGVFLDNVFGTDLQTLRDCNNWTDVLNNQEALDALAINEKFFILQSALSDDYISEIFGNSGALILNSRQGLYLAMSKSESYIDQIRDNVNSRNILMDNAICLLSRGSNNVTIDFSGYYYLVAIGAGGDGKSTSGGTNVTSSGGAGGAYIQKLVTLREGDVVDASISTNGTISSFLNISLGKGGGAPPQTTPPQEGKLILVSSNGRVSNSSTGGGGGGYGGGNGGAAGGASYGAGGSGSAMLPIVEGTGGAGGAHSNPGLNRGADGIGGGGGGGGGANKNNSSGGGGGGGYGGGGGGGGNASNSSSTTYYGYGGKGGSGGIILFT